MNYDELKTKYYISALGRIVVPDGENLSRADLSRANLFGANLSRADLSRANLSGANLYGADLRDAGLYGAGLSGANLSGADLSGADLSGADLYGARGVYSFTCNRFTMYITKKHLIVGCTSWEHKQVAKITRNLAKKRGIDTKTYELYKRVYKAIKPELK